MSEPPALSRDNIQAVRLARIAIEQADAGKWADAPNVILLRRLLEAFDAQGARLAWLADLYDQALHEPRE